jgi:hypothetical protein
VSGHIEPVCLVAYDGGQLHIMNYTASELAANTYSYQYFTDFVLEVETELVEGTDENWHTIGVRYQDTETSYSYYDFSIGADGTYSITLFLEASMNPLVESKRSIHILKGQGVTNLIRVECVGSNLRLSVNGHLLSEVTDTHLQGGDIGLSAASYSGEFTHIAFDNLVVTAP